MIGSFSSSIDSSSLAHVSLDIEENTNPIVPFSMNITKLTPSLCPRTKRVENANNQSIV